MWLLQSPQRFGLSISGQKHPKTTHSTSLVGKQPYAQGSGGCRIRTYGGFYTPARQQCAGIDHSPKPPVWSFSYSELSRYQRIIGHSSMGKPSGYVTGHMNSRHICIFFTLCYPHITTVQRPQSQTSLRDLRSVPFL